MPANSPVQPCLCTQVRPATDADMGVIHAWLQLQERDEVHGTFLCNCSLTEQHAAGDLLVSIDEQSGAPVAYQWGGLLSPGILEVLNVAETIS